MIAQRADPSKSPSKKQTSTMPVKTRIPGVQKDAQGKLSRTQPNVVTTLMYIQLIPNRTSNYGS